MTNAQKTTSPQEATEFGQPPRRSFLYHALTVLLSAVVGLVPLIAGLAVFFDPLRRRSGKKNANEGNWLRVATLDAVPPDGIPRQFPVIADRVDAWNRTADQPIGAVYLRRIEKDDTVECLNAICPHAGCFVAIVNADNAIGKRFQCPCHTSAFALDGEKINLPSATNPSPRGMDPLKVDNQRLAETGEIWIDFENFLPGIHERKAKA